MKFKDLIDSVNEGVPEIVQETIRLNGNDRKKATLHLAELMTYDEKLTMIFAIYLINKYFQQIH